MQYGTVKMWDSGKGFGFIESDEEDEYFFHASDLHIMLQKKGVREGQRVGFDVKREMKGDRAVRVKGV